MSQIVFDPNQISDYRYAKECYQQYKTDPTSVTGYDEDLMTSQWEGYFDQWNSENSTEDVNEYDLGDDFNLDDTDFLSDDSTKIPTASNSEEVDNLLNTGNSGSDKGRKIASGILSYGSMAAGVIGSTIAAEVIATATPAALATGEASVSAVESTVSTVSPLVIVAAAMELAVAALYQASRPNQDVHNALQELRSAFENTDGISSEIDSNTQEISDEQKELEEKQALLQELLAAREAIQQKIDAGETPSDDDLAKLEEIDANIAGLQAEVIALSEKVNASKENNNSIKENLFATQEDANAAFEIAQDAIKSEMTEIVAQTMNVAASTITAVKAGGVAASLTGGVFTAGLAAPYWAAMGMAIAGGIGSAAGVAEQSVYLAQDKEVADILEGFTDYTESETPEVDEMGITADAVIEAAADMGDSIKEGVEEPAPSAGDDAVVIPDGNKSPEIPSGDTDADIDKAKNPFA